MTSLYHPAPECRFYLGEHTASAFPTAYFGNVDKEDNYTYDRTEAFGVINNIIRDPTFGVMDMRRKRRKGVQPKEGVARGRPIQGRPA